MKIDHVHFYTRNAAKVKDWFVGNIGFQAVGSSCDRDTYSIAIALNSACLVFSSPLNTDSQVNQYLNAHPSGVVDIAFRVKNLRAIVSQAQSLGVKILQFPQIKQLLAGKFLHAKIQGWDSLQHTLVEKIAGDFDYGLPEMKIKTQQAVDPTNSSHLTNIDHVVLNVAAGQLKAAVTLYQALFDFKIQQSFNIQTPKSGLFSQALVDETGEVQFNINEPTTPNSQIQKFIDLNRGSGIQHLALRSQNLLADIKQMQRNQVDFLTVPASYYQDLDPHLDLSLQERKAIATQHILVDRDRRSRSASPQSLLMQIFTQPIFERPTFFLEFIERRRQAQGFGQGNFKALFEAVEREQ